MEPLFTYCPQFRDRHCVGNSDVSFLFPLGWLEIAALTMILAEKVLPLPGIYAYIAGGIIAGNLNEFICYKMGFWVYHYDSRQIGTFRPFIPKVTVFGVPVQVMLGYGFVGVMIWAMVYKLFETCF